MANLGRIVQGPDDEEDGDEAVEMALNLLSAIISESVQREISPIETATLQNCLESLETIVKTDKNKSLRSEAKNLISFIRARITMTHLSSEKHIKTDDDAYQQAMEYIKDPLVPIRAQGLSILRNLILQRSTAVDTDSVLDTMIGLLQDEDSYVYLNAIKAIQTLADIHGEQITRKIMDAYGTHTDVDERLRLAETMAGIVRRLGEVFTGDLARQVISRCVRLVSTEEDWRVRVSAVGLASVCCELAPLMAEPAIEMALHLFRMNDLSLGEEGEGAAPLKRGAVAVIAAVLKGGGIDALGGNTKKVLRGIKYLTRSDQDETVRELAQGVMALLDSVIEGRQPDTPWNKGRKIQEL
jgi:Required for nuclear transport of RNA pol II C-terminus 1